MWPTDEQQQQHHQISTTQNILYTINGRVYLTSISMIFISWINVEIGLMRNVSTWSLERLSELRVDSKKAGNASADETHNVVVSVVHFVSRVGDGHVCRSDTVWHRYAAVHLQQCFQPFSLEWNPALERLDCSRNLLQWHRGLFYCKWTETPFPALNYARKIHRLIHVWLCNTVIVAFIKNKLLWPELPILLL